MPDPVMRSVWLRDWKSEPRNFNTDSERPVSERSSATAPSQRYWRSSSGRASVGWVVKSTVAPRFSR
jgi:hypothetical protein